MTAFDVVAGLVLLISAAVGLSRGAVRELVTFFAFSLAVVAAVLALPLSAPIVRHSIHPAWAAKGLALIVVFLAAYIGLRLVGGAFSKALHRQATLGTLDRAGGAGLGLVRGVVALGAFYLVFNAATPPDLAPQWIVSSRLYPLTRASGQALAAVAPGGLKRMGGVGRLLKARVDGADSDPAAGDAPPRTGTAASTYDAPGEPVRHRRTLVIRSDSAQAQ